MQFRSAQRRLVAKQISFGVAFDLALSFVLANAFKDEYTNVWLATVGVAACIWALHLALWLKNCAFNLIKHYVMGNDSVAQSFLDGLNREQLPAPQEYEGSATEYLSRVAQDDTVEISKRISAATSSGWLSYPAAMGRFSESIYLNSAFEKAITAFAEGKVSIK